MTGTVVAKQPASLPPREVITVARDAVAARRHEARLVAHDPLKRHVHRLTFETPEGMVAVVAKRLRPRIARAVALAFRRWLPEAGMGWACPRLRGVATDRAGGHAWHVYEDVGGVEVDRGAPDTAHVEAVMDLVAELHCRFAGHRLLGECRDHGDDLGRAFFTGHVARALTFARRIPVTDEDQRELRDRLVGRVEQLHREAGHRLAVLARWGGPDTLLHGDLWPTNALIVDARGAPRARLIDWDHVGVGPIGYDLSTFVHRFAAADRPAIVRAYRAAAARRGRVLPPDRELGVLLDTAERARYACCVAGAARNALRREPWAFAALADIDTWFEGLEPVLDIEATCDTSS
jgi:aminoglycoside phosphotransferase (APT) family kinase protein